MKQVALKKQLLVLDPLQEDENARRSINPSISRRINVIGRYIKGANFTYNFSRKTLKIEFNEKISKEVSSYIISKELMSAVNAAILTGRPLLLKGEPGCGKTNLAKAVAAHFYGDELSKYYFEWFIKSSSKAKEGAYIFDQVGRLRDATIAPKDEKSERRVKDPANYLRLGPMGLAFVSKPPATEMGDDKPQLRRLPILLIDEIDKGNIDFPNDLLLELDEMRFEIPELNQNPKYKDTYIQADPAYRPLVIITSNDERELPPAFMRRCLYYKIPPFGQQMLEEIVHGKLEKYHEELLIKPSLSKEDVSKIVVKFLTLKEQFSTSKPPSTSELLDWIKVLLHELSLGEPLESLIKDETLQKLALKIIE